MSSFTTIASNGSFLASPFTDRPAAPVNPASLIQERLPFTVRLVTSEEELDKAVSIRHAAYMRHVPGLAETLSLPESMDHQPGSVVLLAESRLDGSPLGTMRIQTNAHKPLVLEQSIALPATLAQSPIAEATRLGVTADRVGRLAKTALFKAFFLYCQKQGIEWMVIAGRSPIDRQYERLMFNDVYPELGYIPLQHAGNMPHRIMSFEIATARARWQAANHPLFEFVFLTHHADIDLSQSAAPVNRAMESKFAMEEDRELVMQ